MLTELIRMNDMVAVRDLLRRVTSVVPMGEAENVVRYAVPAEVHDVGEREINVRRARIMNVGEVLDGIRVERADAVNDADADVEDGE